MLQTHLKNLEASILWAQQQDDIDVLCLARDNMDTLLDFVSTLSLEDQFRAEQHIDQVLPMEWPLWMEACRFQDGDNCTQASLVLH